MKVQLYEVTAWVFLGNFEIRALNKVSCFSEKQIYRVQVTATKKGKDMEVKLEKHTEFCSHVSMQSFQYIDFFKNCSLKDRRFNKIGVYFSIDW